MNKSSIFNLVSKNEVKTIFNIFEKENLEIRLVGGCVRNAILNRESKDFDCSINATPEITKKILKKNNIKYNDFAIRYGSITAFINKKKIEITSLRKDINQQGRHTEIVYTTDWKIDAERRDFTMNSIYLKSNQNIVDFLDGVQDIKNNNIKFIDEIEKSIKQDYLRIYRYFRFLGLFKMPIILENYEEILNTHVSESYNYISSDIIIQEILKMFKTPFFYNCFFKSNEKKDLRNWLIIIKDRFTKNKNDIAINKCINKILSL